MSQIDAVVGSLHIDRTEYFRKLAEEDLVARQYAEAYGKNPVQPDEFFVEEGQLIEVWKDL